VLPFVGGGVLPLVGGAVGGAAGGGVLPHVPNVFVSEEANCPPAAFSTVPNFTR
jgi:hypothetical protein